MEAGLNRWRGGIDRKRGLYRIFLEKSKTNCLGGIYPNGDFSWRQTILELISQNLGRRANAELTNVGMDN